MRDLAERANAVNGNKEEYAGQVDAVSGKLSAANERLFDWYARIWSQGPEGEITPDQVHTFIQEALDTDPVLWGFLRDRTIEMIDEHARGVKKKLMTS
jgi:hypothetical protein